MYGQVFFLFFFGLAFAEENAPDLSISIDEIDEYIEKTKPRLLIFTSNGGGGHRSADKAITQYLHERCDITLSFMVADLLSPLDPIRFFTWHRYGGEDLYNYCLTRRWFSLTNWIGSFGTWSEWWFRKKIEQMLYDFIKDHYDIVISVIPFFNGPLLIATQRLDIPCFIIPTDLDSYYFAYDIKNITYDKWWYVLPTKDKEVLNVVKHMIPHKRMVCGGFPIRPDFFEKKDKEALKQSLNIELDKPVITVIMGAAGSQSCYDCLLELSKLTMPCHIIICCGRNKPVKEKLKTIVLPDFITITVLEFTEKMSDLMAISDLIISKSGSVSVNEVLYMDVPLIIDATVPGPVWERFNPPYIEKYNYGHVLRNYKDLPKIVTRYLTDQDYYNFQKNILKKRSKKNVGLFLQEKIIELFG